MCHTTVGTASCGTESDPSHSWINKLDKVPHMLPDPPFHFSKVICCSLLRWRIILPTLPSMPQAAMGQPSHKFARVANAIFVGAYSPLAATITSTCSTNSSSKSCPDCTDIAVVLGTIYYAQSPSSAVQLTYSSVFQSAQNLLPRLTLLPTQTVLHTPSTAAS